ncbi:MAG: hypothetical protein NUV46_01050 [Nanoarchaeota archaeon]|nr:hypothetical protein [Nanoarchaeota archaeon]
MTGATLGFAAAAAYPAPFVQSGAANVAIVYGTGEGVSSLDMVSVTGVQTSLASYVTGESTTIDGESISLASGSDLYLNDDLAENIQTITKSNLPNTLADGTFTDDGGTDYDYEQTISIGTNTANNVAFSDSDNDFNDPAIIMDLSTSTANYAYRWSVTFDNAVAFNATDSEGEELVLFGKTYTVGTDTDADTLVLLGGSDSTLINVGESKTLTVGGENYVVVLTGISSATTAEAGITVNGESKTFTQGQTKKVAGVDVYMKTVFRTGDNTGYIEVQVGADKLIFESGNAVQEGSDSTDIDGTLVTITGGVNATTAMTIAVAAEDNDANHILMGESFTDPVFGTLSLVFEGANNAPVIVNHKDTSSDRNMLEISKGGDRELQLTFTDSAGKTATVPFTYQDALQDDSSNDIEVVEGATLTVDEYFLLNSGNYQHLMQLTKVDSDQSGQVTFKDLLTGTSYGTNSGTNHSVAQTVYISNQAYTITRVSDTSVNITSSDIATNKAVFPYIELVGGEDHRFAFTDEVAIGDTVTAVANDTAVNGLIYDLPTGSVQFRIADAGVLDANTTTVDYDIDEAGSWTNIAALTGDGTSEELSFAVGTVVYNFDLSVADSTAAVLTIVNASIDTGFSAGLNPADEQTSPGILFVEDEDKSESITTTKNAVLLNTSDSGTYSTVLAPLFSNTVSTEYDTETFDDSDFVGYLTNFGTYVVRDSSDTNQAFASLTYPEQPMYFDVSFAESDSVSSSGGLGDVLVMDSEVSNVSTKNLVIVGGSCINSAAATALGVSQHTCGAAFTSSTGVSAGQFLIKGVQDAFSEGKLALVVAGYEAADTQNAATYLVNRDVDTSSSYMGTSATEATLVVA